MQTITGLWLDEAGTPSGRSAANFAYAQVRHADVNGYPVWGWSACAAGPARHPAVQHIQNIFREQEHRLFHWARDRAIPAENNLAERELRSLVIARKISFGSQSKTGLETRETLMSVLHTLAKRCENALDAFVAMLDSLVENPELDVAAHLFGRAPDAAPS